MDESRKNARFNDFGKVECERICTFPGTLGDISLTGMKVTFDSQVELSMDDEYEVVVRLSKFNGVPIKLLVMPVWKFDDNVNDSYSVQVGFSILPSLEFNKLSEYISKLDDSDKLAEESNGENNSSMTVQVVIDDMFQDELSFQEETPCQFL